MPAESTTQPSLPPRPGPARWHYDSSNGLSLSESALGWLDLADFDSREWKRRLMPRLALADRTRLVEALLRGLDGESVDLQVATQDADQPRMLRLIGDGSRDGRRLEGMLLDVSRDARERDALLELAGLQRSFIDALPWPACAYDEQGDVLLANRLWRRCADCTVELDGQQIELPSLPEWICRHRGDFEGGSAGERHLSVTLHSAEGWQQPARIHRSALRQAGTPLNVLSVESRPVPGIAQGDQEEAGWRDR